MKRKIWDISPLLFIVRLLPLKHILRDVGSGYHFESKGQKINRLLFMDNLKSYTSNEKSLESLIQTLRVFSNDIGMEFVVEICVVLLMKKGKVANSDRIALLNEKIMKGLKEGDSYIYIGLIQAKGTKHHERKKTIKTKQNRRVTKILETKLNGRNIITGINTWGISLLRYSAIFLDRRIWVDLGKMDRRTIKLILKVT